MPSSIVCPKSSPTNVEYDLTPIGGQPIHGVDAIKDAALTLGDGNPVGHHVTNTVNRE